MVVLFSCLRSLCVCDCFCCFVVGVVVCLLIAARVGGLVAGCGLLGCFAVVCNLTSCVLTAAIVACSCGCLLLCELAGSLDFCGFVWWLVVFIRLLIKMRCVIVVDALLLLFVV